jgi:GDP-L-fucose synthase
MKILITGGGGYIGNSLFNNLKKKYNVISVKRQNFDLSNSHETANYFHGKYFDIIIHTAVSGGSRLTTDTYSDMDNNLRMYYNLLNNRNKFGKLIHFGSGAEITAPESPYGLSKRIINKSIIEQNNFYNLRIFGLFDENELDTRFIKSSIQKCKKNEYINIYQNKFFDFFYMQDLLSIVDCYIKNEFSYKLFECTYIKKYTLYDIAKYICNLYKIDHKKNIHVENTELGFPYTGNTTDQNFINFIGLEKGIDIVSKHLYE